MSKHDIVTRTAVSTDARQIAFIHANSWQTTYSGLIDPDFLAQMTPESRVPLWTRLIEEARTSPDEVLFVAKRGDRIVGFVSGGKNRGEETEYTAELKAIYLLQEHQGKGIGHCLLIEFVLRLINRGYNSMILWVLESNHPSRHFYEKMGGVLLPGFKDVQLGKTSARHVAYVWKDLNGSINGASPIDRGHLH